MKPVVVAMLWLTGVVVVAWLGLAWMSGMFLSEEARIDGTERAGSAFAKHKKFIEIDGRRVAYIDTGAGEPLLLLHGCPFSAAEWEAVLPALAQRYRVIAPDWLGLGDTEVSLADDYRLPKDVELLNALMQRLGIEHAKVVAHDHGGAVALLMMERHADKIERLVLTNIEAYDQWPSQPELIYLKLIVNPITSPFVFAALQSDWVRHRIFRIAVYNEKTLNPDILAEWVTPHTASGERWQRLRRFFRWQLDKEHNTVTQTAVPAMRRFDKPTLLLWGQRDTNFGPSLAARLARDIPGTVGVVWMKNSAHMPMIEEPAAYSQAVLEFMSAPGAVALAAK
ncbi:MAG TPA: alpha/beta hydrolase [Burkholderiaceae bacterium]|nr:alpha/beta hydrolase [Burkholderiaceae bacterium]